MKKFIYISLLIAVTITSCKKEAKVKLPEANSLPVIHSYICPEDTVIRLKLTRSQPLYKIGMYDIYEPVRDANVSISSTQGSAQLTYNDNTEYYELKASSYSINMGTTYKVNVVFSTGETATAETQVPVSVVPISTISVEPIVEKFGSYDLIKVFFNDIANQANYYRLTMTYAQIFPFQTDTTYNNTYVSELYSDAGQDGVSSRLSTRYYPPYDTILFTDIYLLNCSPSYYNFHKSLLNYSGDNPFAEPSLTYSNVKGGFGCFGAYTRSRFRYKK